MKNDKVKNRRFFRYNLNSKNSNSFYKGFFFAILFLGVLGALTAVGFHTADEILGGTFRGNYIFNGSVDISNANISNITSSKYIIGTTGLCIGNSCKTNWSQINSNISKGIAVYLCPYVDTGLACNSRCVGQITTFNSCSYVNQNEGMGTSTTTVSCSFVGYLVS